MKFIITTFLLTISLNLYAWDGYDYETGSFVEIDKGNLVRTGEEIEVYSYDTGEYRTLDMD